MTCIMATVKREKVEAECHPFQEKRTNYYFSIEVKDKPVCSVCGVVLAVMKKANLEHHYGLKHDKLNELQGQMHLDKLKLANKQLSQDSILTETGLCRQFFW